MGMDVEFILKLIGGIAALLAIVERVYWYSLKVYRKLKDDQPRQRVQAPSKQICKPLAHNKKNPLILLSRTNLSSLIYVR